LFPSVQLEGGALTKLSYVPTFSSSTCAKSKNLPFSAAVYFFSRSQSYSRNRTDFRDDWAA